MRLTSYLKKGIVGTAITSMALLSGCASLTSQQENDPLEYVNRGVVLFESVILPGPIQPGANEST